MTKILLTAKRIFHQISQIGIEDELPYLDKMKVRFMNQGAFFILIATAYFLFYSIKISSGIWMNVLFVASPIPIFVLNYYKKFNQSRFYTVGVFPFLLLLVFIGFGSETGIEFVYFVLILGILLLYKSNLARAGFIGFMLLIQAVGTYYAYHFPVYYEINTTPTNKAIIFIFSITTLAVIIIELFNEVEKRMWAQEELNAALRQKNKELLERAAENVNKLQLFSILAHDLRRPVSSFHDLSDKISYLIKKGDRERMFEIANLYEKSGKEVSYIMENLLKWVISQKEGIQPFYKKTNLFELVLEIEKEVHVFSGLKNIQFDIDINPKTTWNTDPNILRIILSNIIHNAVKFSDEESKIIISDASIADVYMIKVQDFGIGVASDAINEIKNNIYNTRLGNFTTGHGLGLKSCFALIKHLNGTIEIESEQGVGSSFFVCLPKVVVETPKGTTNQMKALA